MVKRNTAWVWVAPILLFIMLKSSTYLNADPIYNDEYPTLCPKAFFESYDTFIEISNNLIPASPEHSSFYFLVLSAYNRRVKFL